MNPSANTASFLDATSLFELYTCVSPFPSTMKSYASSLIAGAALLALVRAQVPGFDISAYQETTDFAKAYADGDRFVIIKVLTPWRGNMQHLR